VKPKNGGFSSHVFGTTQILKDDDAISLEKIRKIPLKKAMNYFSISLGLTIVLYIYIYIDR